MIVNNKALLSAFSIAPMLDYTDRHYQYLVSLLAPNFVFYTEMITANAIIHGDAQKLLAFNKLSQPLILQLGGSEPAKLAACANLAQEFGFNAINLNIGCPSERVQSGAFGACLMNEPTIVAKCVLAMRNTTDLPITIKTRIGVDNNDSYDFLLKFVDIVSEAGVSHFIIHARKAWLKGLNPKQNRTIPPLNYETVYKLKKDRPDLDIHINGGVTSLEDCYKHLENVNGVMIGRSAYNCPNLLLEIEKGFFNTEIPSLSKIVKEYLVYMEIEINKGIPIKRLARHLIPLAYGNKGAKNWRKLITSIKNDENLKTFQDLILATILH